MKLHAVAAALFRRASCWGRGRVAVASSARRRGVRVVISCVGSLVLVAACSIKPLDYRACLHLHPHRKPSITIHVPGWVVGEHAVKTKDGIVSTRYEFIADAKPTEALSIVCSSCVTVRCDHVSASTHASLALFGGQR